MENILPILVADAPEALIELCGVNLVERLLRILQRLGFHHAIVFSSTPEVIGTELAKPSWARDQINVHLVSSTIGPLTPQHVLEQSPFERFLIIPANTYCDARLLAALCAKDSSAVLVDSNPPDFGTRPDGALSNCSGKRLLRSAFACRPVSQELSDCSCGFQSAAVRPTPDPKPERAGFGDAGLPSDVL